jgi:hypothetical protein
MTPRAQADILIRADLARLVELYGEHAAGLLDNSPTSSSATRAA